MTIEPNTLSNFPEVVADQIKLILPKLKHCKPMFGRLSLEEFVKSPFATPGIRVSNLGLKQGANFSGNTHEFYVQMAAYVATKPKLGEDRNVAAVNITQAIAAHVAENDFGQIAFGRARDVSVTSLNTVKTRDNGTSLWAVIWNQPVILTKYTAQDPMPIELYVQNNAETNPEFEEVGGQE